MSTLSGISFFLFLVVILLLVIVCVFIIRHTRKTTTNEKLSSKNLLLQGIVFIAISIWIFYNGIVAVHKLSGLSSPQTILVSMSVGETCLGILVFICGTLLLFTGIKRNKRKPKQ